MRLAWIVFVLFVAIEPLAQVVQVIDPLEYKPVPDVVISDAKYTKAVKTNMLGEALIEAFGTKDSLIFEHPHYNTKKVAYKTVKKDGFKVFLLDRSFMIEVEVDDGLKRDPPKSNTNSQIKVLSAQDIQGINAQTTADMLEATGSVLVQKSQAGGGSPVIRGFEANRILLVVDGVRMNNAIYRSGHLQNAITIDNNVLSSTDIYFGPGSVIYGSDALGGVVHFHTKNPRFKNEKYRGFGAGGMARYNTANQETTGHFHFELGGKKWAYLASITGSSFGNVRMGENRPHGYSEFGKMPVFAKRVDGVDSAMVNPDPNVQVGTNYEQYDLLQKIRFQATDDFCLTLNTQYSTSSNIGRFDRLNDTIGSVPKYAEWYYGPQNRFLTSLKGEFSNQKGIFNKASIILAYQNIDEDRVSRKFKNDWNNSRFEDVNIFSLNMDFAKNISERESVSYGLEVTYNDVKSTAFSENIVTLERTKTSTRYPDGGSIMSTMAAYLAYDRKLSKYAILNSGIRYSRSILNSLFFDTSFISLPFNSIEFNGGALSGSVGVMVEPDPTSKVNFILSTGFRSPNVDDYGKVFEKNGNVVVPNNMLRPEHAYNGEISFTKSFRQKIKEVTSTEQKAELIRISAGVFYTHLTNAIVRVDYSLYGQDSILYDGEMARVQTNSNATNAFIVGGSGELRLSITPSFSLKSSITYTFGEDLTNSAPLGHIPPLFGQTSMNLERRKWHISLYSVYHGAKQAVDYSPSGEDNLAEATADGAPNWFTINLKTIVRVDERVQIQGAITNMLDRHYKQFSSGISAPGRSFSITLRLQL